MNNPPRTPSRASTHASQDSKISNAQHAALSGATKAFGRPASQYRASGNVQTGAGGGLAAAAAAGSRPDSPQGRRNARSLAPPLVPSLTGGSTQSVKSDVFHAGKTPNLQPPSARQQHTKSPSLQAASLAALRATPQPRGQEPDARPSTSTAATRKPAAPPKPRRLSDHHTKTAAEDAERPTDDSSIPPTTSLVNLFERKASQPQAAAKRPEPIVIKPSNDLPIKSPKPVRTSGGLTSMFQMELPNAKDPPTQTKDVAPRPSEQSSPDSFASASEEPTAPNSPVMPITSQAPARALPSSENERSARPLAKRRSPSPPVSRNATTKPVSIGAPRPGSSASRSERLSPSSASLKSLPAQYNQLYPRLKAPQMTGDQLANAMVASSLASSRQPSPQHAEPPPPPPNWRHRHHTFGFSRTPSPTKGGMRHTLRKAVSDDETDDDDLLHPYGKHKKKRHLRKHPNKHNEGARKRWRDAVTERERKRYEGVWAANKGLHCSFTRSEHVLIKKSPTSEEARTLQTGINDQVSNLVVRDIWSRSRLPDVTLETVWDLVDNDAVGRLSRDEFVVGMFLIDICLKGRKLPNKVSESVWASVRGLQGIKIKK